MSWLRRQSIRELVDHRGEWGLQDPSEAGSERAVPALTKHLDVLRGALALRALLRTQIQMQ
jgi:hypothetical protein